MAVTLRVRNYKQLGASAIEYALALAVIVAMVMAGAKLMTPQLEAAFSCAGEKIKALANGGEASCGNGNTNDNTNINPDNTTPNTNTNVVVDSTADAWDHYQNGNGELVELGPETKKAIMNSPKQLEKAKKIREGRSESMKGLYGIDIESDVFHVGDTPIHYEQTCSGNTCTTVFTSKGDGFWDPVYNVDQDGPKGELPGGTPFGYKPFEWQEMYANPYLDQ